MRTSSKSACTTTHLRARLRDSARQNPGAAESSPSKSKRPDGRQPNDGPDAHRARRDAAHTRELEPVPPETSCDPPSGHHSADESAASASRSLLIETEVSAEGRLMTALDELQAPRGARSEAVPLLHP